MFFERSSSVICPFLTFDLYYFSFLRYSYYCIPITTDERDAEPAVEIFQPPAAKFTLTFPQPNSRSAQNRTNEKPTDGMLRIVKPSGASFELPIRGRPKAVAEETPTPRALMQRDGYTLFPPSTESMLETAISLVFPRPAAETVPRGWPTPERLPSRPLNGGW